jgi:excisionase family DNA binding protein
MALNLETLLTTKQVAVILGVSPGSLNVWRATKRYPLSYVKVGRAVRYRESDVRAFLQSRTVAA